MKFWSVASFLVLVAVSALGQTKAMVSPPEVDAGKDITITVTVDRPASLDTARVTVTIAPKEQKDNAPPYTIAVFSKGNDPKVLSNTGRVPPTAQGVWYVRDAYTQVDSVPIYMELLDHPEFTVKPIEIVVPKTAKVTITVP